MEVRTLSKIEIEGMREECLRKEEIESLSKGKIDIMRDWENERLGDWEIV